MPVPDPGTSCVRFDATIPDFRWRFPFGVSLDIEYNGLPIPADFVAGIIARANAALLPFVPIFDLIDAILSLKAVLEAIKSLNPYKIAEALEAWLKVIDTLKGGIPQIAIPLFLKDAVYVLIQFLVALRDDLAAIIESQVGIDLAGERATLLASADLQAVVDCSQANLDFQLAALQESNAKPLARFIGLVNLFADLAGLPTIPSITIEGNAEESLSAVDDAIEQLTTLHESLPG